MFSYDVKGFTSFLCLRALRKYSRRFFYGFFEIALINFKNPLDFFFKICENKMGMSLYQDFIVNYINNCSYSSRIWLYSDA